MKKWRDINKKNLFIAIAITIIGFFVAGLTRDLITEKNGITYFIEGLATLPFLVGVVLILDEFKNKR